MQLADNSPLHLTYCTNIHPGESWDEVLDSLRTYTVPLKRLLAPDRPFGVGLRLSAVAAAALAEPARLDEFRRFLDDEGLCVAIINGFPFGQFHNRVIKEDVFAPDWRSAERVQYTVRLVEILAALLPEGLDGGISTSPLSYRAWLVPAAGAEMDRMVAHIVQVVSAMARLREATGRWIHLDIEPEPDGLIENSGDTAAWFTESLLPVGAPLLASALGCSGAAADQCLRDHVQVCFDTCHFAVAYEDGVAALQRLTDAGMGIGRIQISSAIRAPQPPGAEARAQLRRSLQPFAESTYLHQVLERRRSGPVRHYPDLPAALAAPDDPEAEEWRIHYHVPLFVEDYGEFGSTQGEIPRVLDAVRRDGLTRHLEIETYTWDVLPPNLRVPLRESIEREYRWVMEQVSPGPSERHAQNSCP
ncbi:MAG TPA: metabolite traffic protein EboE [Chthonomonadaceae bacterium]|nr:metabolite traffic protein EboE [Chthonomonadaceae bacterium]